MIVTNRRWSELNNLQLQIINCSSMINEVSNKGIETCRKKHVRYQVKYLDGLSV